MKVIIMRKFVADLHATCEDWADEIRSQAQAELERGKWHFVGVVAEAEIHFPYGQDTIVSRLESPGLWSVQSNSSEDYLNEVFAQEAATLKEMIEALRAGPVEYEVKTA